MTSRKNEIDYNHVCTKTGLGYNGNSHVRNSLNSVIFCEFKNSWSLLITVVVVKGVHLPVHMCCTCKWCESNAVMVTPFHVLHVISVDLIYIEYK